MKNIFIHSIFFTVVIGLAANAYGARKSQLVLTKAQLIEQLKPSKIATIKMRGIKMTNEAVNAPSVSLQINFA